MIPKRKKSTKPDLTAFIKINSFIVRIFFIVVFIAIVIGVITYARGYRPDFKTGNITPTGILAITSSPKAAKVYVNGILKGATDLNLTLPPGEYLVELKKEGYTDWKKRVNVKGEIVMSVDGLIFPKNPSLSPLTSLGVIKSIPVNQTNKMIIISKNDDKEKDGLYLFEMNKRPLSLLPPLKLIILNKFLPQNILLESVTVSFSPNYRQGIFDFNLAQGGTVSYLLSIDEENTEAFDITSSKETLLTAWREEKNKALLKILEAFPKEFIKIATDSTQLIAFSPDESKILYTPVKPTSLPPIITPPLIGANQTKEERLLQPNRLYIYDRKEDKNFEVKDITINKLIPNPSPQIPAITPIPEFLKGDSSNLSILWYPDSKHFIIKEKKEINVIDYDGDNKRVLYSGPFEESFFNITDEGKLLILTNLNPQRNLSPDLYEVGIR